VDFSFSRKFLHRKVNPISKCPWDEGITIAYCVFAFSAPAIVVTVGLVLHHPYKWEGYFLSSLVNTRLNYFRKTESVFGTNDVESNIMTPNYGGLKCFLWVSGRRISSRFTRFTAPLAILIITKGTRITCLRITCLRLTCREWPATNDLPRITCLANNPPDEQPALYITCLQINLPCV